MTYPDPTYGSSPIDPEERWYETMRGCLINDDEMKVWQSLITDAVGELAASIWLTQWRTKSASTAFGVHLDAKARDFNLLRPGGWSDERFQPVAAAVEGTTLGSRPPSVTAKLAEALTTGDQTWEMAQADPAHYVVIFYGITEDEALTYFTILNLGRPTGVRLVMVYSDLPKDGVFIIGESLIGSADVIAKELL